MSTCLAHPEPGLRTMTLRDGTRIATRPIQAADAPALQQFHHRLSRQAIYSRFF